MNERETGDLLPSAVSLRYTTRGLEENGGRSVTGTRVEDNVEALGARNREVGRGGRDKVETRWRCRRYSRIEDVESHRRSVTRYKSGGERKTR